MGSSMCKHRWSRIGFIGLGVMGAAQAARLVDHASVPVTVFDIEPSRTAALVARGAQAADTVAEVAGTCELIFLSLPGEQQVRSTVVEPAGLLSHLREGTVIVDLSTVPVSLAKEMAVLVRAVGGEWVDAPVARTKQAAIDGTLSIMVGCDSPELFEELVPVLSCMGTSVKHCGHVGAGALLKLANNTITFQTVVAICEVFALARRSGLVDAETLFQVLEDSSAQSWTMSKMAHGPLVSGVHPAEAFPAKYMLKDIGYALASADEYALDMRCARVAAQYLVETCESGYADLYHTAVINVIDAQESAAEIEEERA